MVGLFEPNFLDPRRRNARFFVYTPRSTISFRAWPGASSMPACAGVGDAESQGTQRTAPPSLRSSFKASDLTNLPTCSLLANKISPGSSAAAGEPALPAGLRLEGRPLRWKIKCLENLCGVELSISKTWSRLTGERVAPKHSARWALVS